MRFERLSPKPARTRVRLASRWMLNFEADAMSISGGMRGAGRILCLGGRRALATRPSTSHSTPLDCGPVAPPYAARRWRSSSPSSLPRRRCRPTTPPHRRRARSVSAAPICKGAYTAVYSAPPSASACTCVGRSIRQAAHQAG
eukprot:364345-Chlamydomonas_euryale.AAC.3